MQNDIFEAGSRTARVLSAALIILIVSLLLPIDWRVSFVFAVFLVGVGFGVVFGARAQRAFTLSGEEPGNLFVTPERRPTVVSPGAPSGTAVSRRLFVEEGVGLLRELRGSERDEGCGALAGTGSS